MTVALLVVAIVVVTGCAWWYAPAIKRQRDIAQRYREIDRIKRQTLAQFGYERDLALRRREARDRQRLDRIIHDLDA